MGHGASSEHVPPAVPLKQHLRIWRRWSHVPFIMAFIGFIPSSKIMYLSLSQRGLLSASGSLGTLMKALIVGMGILFWSRA